MMCDDVWWALFDSMHAEGHMAHRTSPASALPPLDPLAPSGAVRLAADGVTPAERENRVDERSLHAGCEVA
jgi:hypothetical protein